MTTINIDFKGKTFVVFGLRGTGKSTAVDLILSEHKQQALYYDTLHEAAANSPFDVYKPKDRYSSVELEAVLTSVIPKSVNNRPYYSMIVIDESNRFCPPKPSPLPPKVADLNDICRHYRISAGFVARRPVQLNQDLTELADYIFCFHLKGKNDVNYLNNLADNLGDTVKNLGQYEFVLVHPNRSFDVMNPLPARKEWIDNANRLLGK